jgi:hypothetical protein
VNLFDSQDGISLVSFDPDEEEAVAQLVFDLLQLICLELNHYEFLRDLFRVKANGNFMPATDLVEVLGIAAYYEELDVKVNIPDLPFRQNAAKLTREQPRGDLEYQEYLIEQNAFRARLWKDVWAKNPKLHQWGDFFPFPGDHLFERVQKNRSSTWDSEAELRNEEMFWKEVTKIEREYEISREQAILVVSDYIPRGLMKDGTKMVEALAQKGDSEMTLSERLDRMFAEPDPVDAPWEEKA